MLKSYITIGLSSLTMLSIGVLGSISVFADDPTVDDVNIAVPISCTLEGVGMNSHEVSLDNGQYSSSIGETTLKAYCNDNNGLAIYAIGYTDNEDGKNVLSNASLGSTHDIVTGTATSGNTSQWAMKLSTITSPVPTYPIIIAGSTADTERETGDLDYSAFQEVPDRYQKVAYRTSMTDVGQGAEGSTLKTTYQAFVSTTQPAGTYVGQVKYVMVHPSNEVPLQPQPCEASKICYHPNASVSEIIGEMGKQSASNNASITLYASNYKRDGYGFAGWNDKYDYTGTFYGPNQTITAPSNISSKGLSLYAVWVKSVGSLQDSTKVAELCGTGTGSLTRDPNDGTADLTTVTALTDERDNNTYAIAKLSDGKCWMIENLRLADKDSNNNDIILTSQNTHNPSLPLNNSWYYKNQQGTLTTSNHLSATSDPTSTNPDTAWCQTHSSDCDDQSMVATNNTTLYLNNAASSYSATSNVYSYGNYYNWYSATAGHGKYGSSYGSSFVAPGDICPAGWHLPKGGNKSQESNNESWQLIVTGINNGTNPANYDSDTRPFYTGTPEGTTASNALRTYPNNFVYSGYVSGSSVSGRNSYGHYWSASGYYTNNAYSMGLTSSLVNPGTGNDYKYNGWMVRCVSGV